MVCNDHLFNLLFSGPVAKLFHDEGLEDNDGAELAVSAVDVEETVSLG